MRPMMKAQPHFLLTLTLSPEEREQPPADSGFFSTRPGILTHGLTAQRRTIPPLPRGEGREGESGTRNRSRVFRNPLMHGLFSGVTRMALLLATYSMAAGAKLENSTARPAVFAPMPADHELASIWNDPDFARRLVGSYGFASDAEPRMTPEEQAVYRDKIVPLLREDPRKAIGPLESLVKPSASAVFDFTLGNVYFQNDDLTNAVKHFEAALAKFPDYRRAQK